MQCRREESKGESEKLSPWSEGIGEADSLPSVAVPQKGKISKNKRSGRFFKFTIDFGEAKFQSLMRQREGFHTCRRHVFHAQRQLCFHTAACSGIYIHRHSRCNSLSVATSYRCISSGTSCLPKELKFANIGILKALETFPQGTEVYCAMSIGCTAAYAAVTGRRYAAQ